MVLKRLRKFIDEWGKVATDRPRDEFRVRLRGELWQPILRCTVCDTRSEFAEREKQIYATRYEFVCPNCETEGAWISDRINKKYRLDNLYPDEWGGNPYDRQI